MRKIPSFAAGLLMAGSFVIPVALAQDYSPPPDANIQFTAPRAGATVSTIFTVSGTVNAGCQMGNTVYVADNSTSGYIESVPRRSGNTFSYTLDASKVLTREGLDPYTLKDGKIAINVYVDYPPYPQQPTCGGGGELILTLQHPGTPPAPQAVKKEVEVPRPLVSPSPSPSPEAPASPEAEVKGSVWDKLDPQWWFLIGCLVGALGLAGAEWSARRYRRRHPKG